MRSVCGNEAVCMLVELSLSFNVCTRTMRNALGHSPSARALCNLERYCSLKSSLGPKFTRVLAAFIKFILRFRAASSA